MAKTAKKGLSKGDLKYFTSQLSGLGIKKQVIPGILSSLSGESYRRLDPTAKNSIGAIGIAQHLFDRKKALLAEAASSGKPWTDPRLQIDFIVKELQGPESGALKRLKSATTPHQGNSIWTARFERPHKLGSTALKNDINARARNIGHFQQLVSGFGSSGDVPSDLPADTPGWLLEQVARERGGYGLAAADVGSESNPAADVPVDSASSDGSPLDLAAGAAAAGDVGSPGALGVGLISSLNSLLGGFAKGAGGRKQKRSSQGAGQAFLSDFYSQIPGVPSGGLEG